MATATRELHESRQEEPQLFSWTKYQYHVMADLGWFQNARVELIEGEIWDKYPAPAAEPRPFMWTVERYEQMAEMGWFDDVRTELLEGEIIKMCPISSPHSAITTVIRMELERAFGAGYFARIQMPLRILALSSEPEPDVALVAGSALDYEDENPVTAVLVVEVADTTLGIDRIRKAAIYAAAEIPEYWIANLQQNQLEIFREPVYDERGPRYSSTQTLTRRHEIAPLAKPDARIKVADLITGSKGPRTKV